jgi:hypothetical protein
VEDAHDIVKYVILSFGFGIFLILYIVRCIFFLLLLTDVL